MIETKNGKNAMVCRDCEAHGPWVKWGDGDPITAAENDGWITSIHGDVCPHCNPFKRVYMMAGCIMPNGAFSTKVKENGEIDWPARGIQRNHSVSIWVQDLQTGKRDCIRTIPVSRGCSMAGMKV